MIKVRVITKGRQGPPGPAGSIDPTAAHAYPEIPPKDADEITVLDSTGGLFTAAKATFLGVKTFLKTYFDGLYMSKSVYDTDGDGLVDHAESVPVMCRNNTAAIMPALSAVYITGAIGQLPTVALAKADAEVTSRSTLALLPAALGVNANGYATTAGVLHNVNTSAFLDGDSLWLSAAVAGGLTTTRPPAPNHAVFIGFVAYAHATQGKVVISIQNGHELDELHDVLITTIADKDMIVYDAATGVWRNQTSAVVKTNLALNNVDNTSDVNKPVSTAQASADTAVLNASKAYADGLVVGLLDDRGSYDASVNTFPASGGSGTAGAILKGDLWYIGVAGSLGGALVAVGDSVRAMIDAPGQTAANWSILEANIGYVPENNANKSTSIVTDQSSDIKFPSVKAVYDWVLGFFVGKTSSTGSAANPSGTTAQRDVTPAVGYTRINTTLSALEAYISGAWVVFYDLVTTLATKNLWTAQQRPKYLTTATAAGGGSFAFNPDDHGQIALITLSTAGVVTFSAPANIVEGSPYTMLLKAGDTGARTFAWNAAFKFGGATSALSTATAVSGAIDSINWIGGAANTLIYNGHKGDIR